MNVAVKPEVTEAAQIEAALDQVLAACIEYLNRPRDPDATYKVYSLADLAREYAEEQSMTAAQRASKRLIDGVDGPVGEALRQAVEVFGQRLHELGGTELMGDVLDRVAERDAANWGRRTDIMDKRWDGIGTWVA